MFKSLEPVLCSLFRCLFILLFTVCFRFLCLQASVDMKEDIKAQGERGLIEGGGCVAPIAWMIVFDFLCIFFSSLNARFECIGNFGRQL